jgi:hypothetical protein
MMKPSDPTESFAALDQVITDYLQAVDAGRAPNRDELDEGHPGLAEPLSSIPRLMISSRTVTILD